MIFQDAIVASNPTVFFPLDTVYPKNLVSDNVASGTDTLSNTTGFNSNGNFTLSSDTAQYYQGSRALKMVCTASPNPYVTHGGIITNGTLPVVTGRTYTFAAYAMSTTITRSFAPRIYWYTAAGANISLSAGTSTALSSSWQLYSVTAQAPANAEFASVMFFGSSVAVSETLWTDQWGFWESTSLNWSMPATGSLSYDEINGSLSASITSGAEVDYWQAAGSQKSVRLLQSQEITYPSTLPISTAIWQKPLTFECLYTPTSTTCETVLFKSNNTYRNVSDGTTTTDSVFTLKYVGGAFYVKLGGYEKYSEPIEYLSTMHVAVQINNSSCTVFVNGIKRISITFPSMSYESLTLTSYKTIATTGTAYISNVAIYNYLLDEKTIVSHAINQFFKIDTTSADYSLGSVNFRFDQEEFNTSKTIDYSSNTGIHRAFNATNIKIDGTSASLNTVPDFEYSGPPLQFTADGVSGAKAITLTGFEQYLSPGSSVLSTVKFYDTTDTSKHTIWCFENGSKKLCIYRVGLNVYLEYQNGDQVVSNYCSLGAVASTVPYTLTVDTTVQLTDGTNTVSVALDSLDVFRGTLSIGNNAYGNESLNGCVKDFKIKIGNTVVVNAALTTDLFINVSGSYDVIVFNSEASTYFAEWYPQIPEITVSYNSSAIEPGQTITSTPPVGTTETLTLTVSISNSRQTKDPKVSSIFVNKYTVTPIEAKNCNEKISVTGVHKPPLLPSSMISSKASDGVVLNAGKLLLNTDYQYANIAPDTSFYSKGNWTVTNSVAENVYDPTLSSNFGVRLTISGSSGKIESGFIKVASSASYEAVIKAKCLTSGNGTVTVDFYDSSKVIIVGQSLSATYATVDQYNTDIFTSGTSPSTAKYAKISFSSTSSGNTFILDNCFLGTKYSTSQYFDKQYSGIALLYRNLSAATTVLFTHTYKDTYSITTTAGVITYAGFSTVKVNGVSIASGTYVGDYGPTLIEATLAADDLLFPSATYTATINNSAASGIQIIALKLLKPQYTSNTLFDFCGVPSAYVYSETSTPSVSLTDEFSVNASPWTLLSSSSVPSLDI